MSGLASTLKAATAAAFDGPLADAVKSISYAGPKTGSMNAATGTYDTAGSAATGRSVVEEVSQKDVGGSFGRMVEQGPIRVGDKKLTYLVDEIVDSGGAVVEMLVDGKVTIDGKAYTIVKTANDPTDTVGETFVRG